MKSGDSVVLVTLAATFLSVIFYIEWETKRFAVSLNFSSGVTVLVVFHSDESSTKAVIVFVVLGDFVRMSPVRADSGLAVLSLEAVLTSISKSWNWIRPCVVSLTTLFYLMKCSAMIGPVKSFILTKSLAKVKSPTSSLSVADSNDFSNCPFVTCN